ncbi:hypothetical protein FZC76_09720 [Sutcliffiella horikoshii]|uniref:Uncharacterized protein n=1 Tax=Sutcliffiella horikoshii TaxID=79883 RepID=A0A5D4T1P3_9BACI|nr:hypothetical protein FZC76_09720 [Sutcliffiella horikoshii]
MEQKAKTPEGDKGSLRPLKRCEEAQAPSLGKRSHLRKSTAVINKISKSRSFSVASLYCAVLLCGQNFSFMALI